MLPLCVLLVTALVLLYRRHSRVSRNEANAVLSRDRANFLSAIDATEDRSQEALKYIYIYSPMTLKYIRGNGAERLRLVKTQCWCPRDVRR